jgi:hypothetical protein
MTTARISDIAITNRCKLGSERNGINLKIVEKRRKSDSDHGGVDAFVTGSGSFNEYFVHLHSHNNNIL